MTDWNTMLNKIVEGAKVVVVVAGAIAAAGTALSEALAKDITPKS